MTGLAGDDLYGQSYQVFHRGWQLDVLVKVPSSDVLARTACRDVLLKEVDGWAAMGVHPHVVACYYTRLMGGVPRLFCEYVEGPTLAEWISRGRLYEEGALARVLDVSLQVLNGLHHAHEHGVIHGNLRPTDIIMAADGTARVTNFGLIKAVEMARRSRRLVRTTAGQRAPELLASASTTRRTDMWGLGITLLEMLIGGDPFKTLAQYEGELADVVEELLSGDKKCDVPAPLTDLVKRCVADLPTDRPVSLKKVREELRDIYRQAVGRDWNRPEPDVSKADSLNNRALAMLDLGRPEEAEKLLDNALAIDPEHLYATYNNGLLQLRGNRIDWETVQSQMEALDRTWEQQYLLGRLALEQKDVKRARTALQQAAQEAERQPVYRARVQKAMELLEAADTADANLLTAPPAVARIDVIVEEQPAPAPAQGLAPPPKVSTLSAAEMFHKALEGAKQALEAAHWNEALGFIRKAQLSPGFDRNPELTPIIARLSLHVGRGGPYRASAERQLLGHRDAVMGVAVSHDGRQAISASFDRNLMVWDVEAGVPLRTLEGHNDAVMAVTLTPDGEFAISASYDKTLRLWEVNHGRCLRIFEGHEDSVMDVATTPDARVVVSGSHDRTVRVWNGITGRCMQTLEGHEDAVMGVAIAADGRTALSASYDHTIRVWDLATGGCLRTLEGHKESVWGVALSLDGKTAVTASDDRTLRVWDVSSGRTLSTLKGHTDSVCRVALTPDARLAVSSSYDRTVRIWDLQSGHCVESLGGHNDIVTGIAITPDGRRVISGGSDKVLQVWSLEWEMVPREPILWDEAAQVCLESFVNARQRKLRRSGLGMDDFVVLLLDLGRWGFGWLRPEGVLKEFEAMLGPDFQRGRMLPPAPVEVDTLIRGAESDSRVSRRLAKVEAALRAAPQPKLTPLPPEPLGQTAPEPPPQAEEVLPLDILDTEPPLLPPALMEAPPAAPEPAPAPVAETPAEPEPQPAPPPPPIAPLPPPPPSPGLLSPQPMEAPLEAPLPPPAIEPPPPLPEAPARPMLPVITEGRKAYRPPSSGDIKGMMTIEQETMTSTSASTPDAMAAIPAAALEARVQVAAAKAEIAIDQAPPAEEIFAPPQGRPRPAETVRPAPATPAPPRVGPLRETEGELWSPDDILENLYRVTRYLGEGTLGKVYKVFHPSWNLELAVRVPRPAICNNQELRSRWVQEAQQWIDLGVHPHVVGAWFTRTLRNIPVIFVEHAEGGTLTEWIDSGQLYDGGPDAALARMIDIAIQMSRGLAYAHDVGMVHQDVKPGNVMMTIDGTARLTDFGLGRIWQGTLDEDRLAPGREAQMNIGGLTPAYCSPEQARKEAVSSKTDMWSWGLSILHMFTGEVTWRNGRDAGRALAEYLDVGAENEQVPRMPDRLADLLRRCFEIDPERRPRTLSQVSAVLQEIYHKTTGETYSRAEPTLNDLKAATCNNKALVALNFGDEEQADHWLNEAAAANPHCAHAIYNKGLLLLRIGKLPYESLLHRLKKVQASPASPYELQMMHGWLSIERGDEEEARRALYEAARDAWGDPDGLEALARAVAAIRPGNRTLGTIMAHQAPIWDVAISQDGSQAVTASDDGSLRVWDSSNGQCLATLEGHDAAVFAVVLTADGKKAISAGDDTSVRVWDLGSGTCQKVLREHQESVTGVAVTADGKIIASVSWDGTLRLWEMATGRCSHTLMDEDLTPPGGPGGETGVNPEVGPTDGVVPSSLTAQPRQLKSLTAVAMGADSKVVLVGADNGAIAVWDVPGGVCVRKLPGHTEKVNALALTPDGRIAVSASDDRTLRVWDVVQGTCLHVLEGHNGWVHGVAITPDGRQAVSAGWDRTLKVWELATGRPLYTLTGHDNHVRAVALMPGGKLAVSGDIDGVMRFSEVPTDVSTAPWLLMRARESGHKQVNRYRFGEGVERARNAIREKRWKSAASTITEMRTLPGFEWVPLALELSGEVMNHAGRGALRAAWSHTIIEARQSNIRGVASSADGNSLMTANGDGRLQFWDLTMGRSLRTVAAHEKGVAAVTMTPDGTCGFSCGGDGLIKMWALPQGECLQTMSGHTEAVWGVASSWDGKVVVSASWDGSVRLWNATNGKCVRVLRDHDGPVLSVAMAPAGHLAISGSADNTVRVWDLSNGRCVRVLEGHTDLVGAVAILPDGNVAVSGSNDQSLRVWDLNTGKCLLTLNGHRGPIAGITVTPDGRMLASASWDWTVRLWELPSGRLLRTLSGHLGCVRGVVLPRDARGVVSVSEDGTMRLWQMDWDLLARDLVDWDEGAEPCLRLFVNLHRKRGLARRKWNDDDLRVLQRELSEWGYGWLKPEGVMAHLQKATGD
ncbi:MAG: protein kinase domain-containing protein [Candidatus Xenobia bacterium]